ncbi:hypothetical protein AGMMS50267_00230 [Spirochaetia bacterium]|nr:hypothetical protein AGMMS50267_00230 [Spirochaetia bacterium]
MRKSVKNSVFLKCGKVLLGVALALAFGACPQTTDDSGPVKVTDVTIQSGGADTLGYVLWAPADTNAAHPKSVTLDAVIAPANAADPAISWASSRPDVATVNDGVVTAAGAGEAVIIVTTHDGKHTALCFISVLPAETPFIPVTGVTVSSSISPNVNNRYDVPLNSDWQFVAEIVPADASQQGVIWESSDPAVAAIGTTGFVNALRVGTATITATTAGNKADGAPAIATFSVMVLSGEQTWYPPAGYVNTPLSPSDPVAFYGSYVMYMNERINLNDHTIYIDGTLSDAVVAAYPNVYNDFMAAYDDGAFKEGTEAQRMRVLIAPWVYWCDSLGRDNPATATAGVGTGLYGMALTGQAWLSLEGLSQDPYNVILCGNRGQSHGSNGNWTLFNITMTGEFLIENLTIANYCSLALEYPLNPALDVPARTTTSTQSQLVGGTGASRLLAKNSNFISRLNLMPPTGSRTLYVDCHFESTDDSLAAGAVYLHCDFDFFSNRPWGGLGGAVLLDSTFNSHIGYNDTTGQLLSKGDANGVVIDGKFIHPNPNMKAGWTLSPAATRRNYQYNVTMNGKQIVMSEDKPGVSVKLENHPKLLKAYRFVYGREVVYNTYNLLRGNDDWDPMQIKDKVAQASALDPDHLDYGKLPTQMTASVSPTALTYAPVNPETADTNYTVGTINPNTDTSVAGAITWTILSGNAGAILSAHTDPNRKTVTSANTTYGNIPVVIEAVSAYGLHAAVQLTSIPAQISAPTFTAGPAISYASGRLTLDYTLNVTTSGIEDQSLITWYRADDAGGTTNKIQVMTSRLNEPEPEYTLTSGDVGKYIFADITPKYQISPAGTLVSVAYAGAIATGEVANPNVVNINFRSFPVDKQELIAPGVWTRDLWRPWVGFQPAEFKRDTTQLNPALGAGNPAPLPNANPFVYKAGTSAMEYIYGHMVDVRFARLMYTPPVAAYNDMSITVELATEKTGQGFGSAEQYMDFMIKYDSATNSGYGLRVERIGASGSATVINLVKYDNVEYGVTSTTEGDPFYGPTTATPRITYLTDNGYHSNAGVVGGVSKLSKLYATFCTIELKVEGNTLSARVSRDGESRTGQVKDGTESYVPLELDYTHADIGASNFGGIMFSNTGTMSQNTTGLRFLDVEWQ